MKKIMKSTSVLALATVGLFSFNVLQTASIKGTVAPADGFSNVWAITGTDSLKAITDQGSFSFTDAKPGTYQVVVEGKAPYKNFVKDSVVVTEGGQPVDLGTITLEQ
jgi:hypothetical protein